MSDQDQIADVVIVGGGMVGASMACALGPLGIKVVLLEASEIDTKLPEQGYELRVSAITHASQRLFESLGAWDDMLAQRVSPFREMHVWDEAGNGVVHFDSADIGEAHLGHIIENKVTVNALYKRLRAFKNIEVITGNRLLNVENGSENASLALKDGKTINTRLVIAADGSRSALRQQANISVRGWDYDHAALVTWVKCRDHHRDTAWQRFLSTGPLAFLPLPNGYCSIVWSTAPDEAERLRTLDEKLFKQELEEAFESTLGEIEAIGPRACFPLRFFITNEFVRPRLALIGDAAHTVHPLAGQGVNLGLGDVATLAEVINDAVLANKDIGQLSVLRRYERWRRADSVTLLATMDSLKRLYGSEVPALRWLRNLGMNITNQLGPIKNLIVRNAMGMDDQQPRLARGLPLSARNS